MKSNRKGGTDDGKYGNFKIHGTGVSRGRARARGDHRAARAKGARVARAADAELDWARPFDRARLRGAVSGGSVLRAGALEPIRSAGRHIFYLRQLARRQPGRDFGAISKPA